MALAKDYDSVMARSNDIMKKALGLDYNEFESGTIGFDYEALMKATGYTLEEVAKIQARTAVDVYKRQVEISRIFHNGKIGIE